MTALFYSIGAAGALCLAFFAVWAILALVEFMCYLAEDSE